MHIIGRRNWWRFGCLTVLQLVKRVCEQYVHGGGETGVRFASMPFEAEGVNSTGDNWAEARAGSVLSGLAKRNPILMFVVLTCLLGWGVLTPRVLHSIGLTTKDVPNWWIVTAFYAPSAAGLWMQWLTERNLKVCRIYGSWIRLGRGVVIGVVLMTISTVVVPALIAGEAQLKSLNWAVFFAVATYHLRVSDSSHPLAKKSVLEVMPFLGCKTDLAHRGAQCLSDWSGRYGIYLR